MDNMSFSSEMPGEEEQPLASTSLRSGIHSLFFPNNRSYLDKYNFFEGISAKEFNGWKMDFLYVVKAISLYNQNKPLVLKSPHNTGRVKALIELFPNAKFIFIHRDPYDVYLSTVHLFNTIIRDQMLQNFSSQQIEDTIIYIFRNTLKNYLVHRHLIPKEHLIEVPYSDLASNPMKTMKKIYYDLKIPAFEAAKPHIHIYLDSVKGYKKNTFTDLPESIKTRINEEWSFFFDEFGYKKRP